MPVPAPPRCQCECQSLALALAGGKRSPGLSIQVVEDGPGSEGIQSSGLYKQVSASSNSNASWDSETRLGMSSTSKLRVGKMEVFYAASALRRTGGDWIAHRRFAPELGFLHTADMDMDMDMAIPASFEPELGSRFSADTVEEEEDADSDLEEDGEEDLDADSNDTSYSTVRIHHSQHPPALRLLNELLHHTPTLPTIPPRPKSLAHKTTRTVRCHG